MSKLNTLGLAVNTNEWLRVEPNTACAGYVAGSALKTTPCVVQSRSICIGQPHMKHEQKLLINYLFMLINIYINQ